MPVKRADKTPMPVRDPGLRAHDFEEVNEGYCFSHAMFEAERCLRCQDPVLYRWLPGPGADRGLHARHCRRGHAQGG